FIEKGILVHASLIPKPLSYGDQQTCVAGIPWPNERFFYALMAFDESGNPSSVSNLASIYVYEAPTTISNSESDLLEGATIEGNLPYKESTQSNSDWSTTARTYVIAGTVSGLILIILLLILFAVIRSKGSKYGGEDKDNETYHTFEP
ncbi:Epithelial chloride channel proteinlike, partial [Caligus rogercresseyi]